jgi:gliding motility-associated-like protein
LTHGSTFVWIKRGLDGNTLLSECGSEIPEFQDTVNIVVIDNSVWAPATDSVGCIFNDFTVDLLDSVYCFSIANDGSDVRLVDGSGTNYPIANVFGYCSPNGLKTNQLLVRMSANTSAAGPLYLIVNNAGGTDGNTVANNCGRFLSGTDTLAILYIDNKIPINLGSDQTICSFDPYPTLDCGYSNISYQWYSASGAISGATQQTYTPTAAGSYSVVASGGPGCSGTDTVVVNVIPAAADNLGADQLLCVTDPMPTLNAGNQGATYQWFLDGTAVSGATSQTFTPTPALPAGSYTVSVEVNTGNAQCIANFDVVLQVISAPVLAVADESVCEGTAANLDATTSNATSYLWSNGATSPTINPTAAGNYIVTVAIGNCASSDTASVIVKGFPAAPIVACNPGGSSGFKFVYVWALVAGNNGYEVSEDDGATWIPANQPTGLESHGVNVSIERFRVRAIVSAGSTQWCGPGRISDPAPCEVEIPNIFTPNGDGKNEFFEIKNIEQYANNSVQIFNRWGKEVYSATGYNNDTKKFDGKDLPDGVYYYIVDLSDGKTPLTGTVNIHR